MAMNASDILVESLLEWGVDTIFGLPGDGVNGIFESLRKKQKEIRFIQVRHEESAAFMACAYAKYTGRIGVCIATSGPGGIHLLNGLYDAKLDGQPVLAITGMQAHDLTNTLQQQDVELDKVFMDVSVYNTRVMGPSHVEPSIDLAIRTAYAQRGVAHVTIPVDVQTMEVTERSERNRAHHSSIVHARGARSPLAEDVERAAAIINSGSRVAILAGRGALGCRDLLEQLAEKVAGPIVKPLLGKACVPDESPYTTGGIGLLGTEPSQVAMEECDTLVIIGSSFPYIEFYPPQKKARAVQIELDAKRIGLRYPVEVGLVGDSRSTLELLLPLIHPKTDRSFLTKSQERMQNWWKVIEGRTAPGKLPMRPQFIVAEISKCLRDDAIVSSDSGTIAAWSARHIRMREGQMYSLSGNLATMANGLPYTIAAQLAYPNRQCVAIVGDGGFSMLMAEMATAVKYKLPIKVFIIKNNTLGQIKWEQLVFLGNPEYAVDLQPIDFAMFAKSVGAKGITIEDPERAAAQVEEALSTPGPVVIECVVDPFEPPYPPKATLKQAAHLAEALLRGEPNAEKIALTVLSDQVREMI
jgi:pyruvate dehydrogenase (quinone)/pyruvate oxidase